MTKTALQRKLREGGTFEDFDLRMAAPDGIACEQIAFRDCLLPRKSEFAACGFQGCEIKDSWLLSGCKVAGGALTNCVIAGAEISSAKLNLCAVSKSAMSQSYAKDSLFAQAKFLDTELRGCDTTEMCSFEACIFGDCQKALNCEMRKKVVQTCRRATGTKGRQNG